MKISHDTSHAAPDPRLSGRSIQPISQSDFCEEGAELIERWRTASAPFQTNEIICLDDEVMSYEENMQEARAALIYHREHCPLCMTKPVPQPLLDRTASTVLALLLALLAGMVLCLVYIAPDGRKRKLPDF